MDKRVINFVKLIYAHILAYFVSDFNREIGICTERAC